MQRGGQREGAGRPGNKLKAESTLTLDIRSWKDVGIDNDVTLFELTWRGWGEPEPQMIILKISDTVKLTYQVRQHSNNELQERKQVVPLERTAPHYGGVRKWFQCPDCSRRCELLYFRFGHFACRLCQKIAYQSQSRDTIDRLTHKLQKLEAPLHAGRPKGMHRTTAKRIVERALSIEATRDELIHVRLAAMGCDEDFF